jgi:hypothetical protein
MMGGIEKWNKLWLLLSSSPKSAVEGCFYWHASMAYFQFIISPRDSSLDVGE